MKKPLKVIIIIVLIIILLNIWKIPVYIKLHSINIPDNSEIIKTDVDLSDVYWWHIVGEMLIKSDLTYDELEKYIKENNSEKKLRNIKSYSFFYSETDDCAIYSSDYEDKVEKEDRDKYTIIKYFKKLQD